MPVFVHCIATLCDKGQLMSFAGVRCCGHALLARPVAQREHPLKQACSLLQWQVQHTKLMQAYTVLMQTHMVLVQAHTLVMPAPC